MKERICTGDIPKYEDIGQFTDIWNDYKNMQEMVGENVDIYFVYDNHTYELRVRNKNLIIIYNDDGLRLTWR